MIPSDAVANQAASEGIVTGGSENQAQLTNPDYTSSSRNDPTTSMIIDQNDTRQHTPPNGADSGSSQRPSGSSIVTPTDRNTEQTETQNHDPRQGDVWNTAGKRPRKRPNKRKPHQIYKENLETIMGTRLTTNYKKYFVISPVEETDLIVDEIRGNKDLTNKLGGKPTKVTATRNGQLLVEVSDSNQSQNILKIDSILEIKVKVEPHKSLNIVKGTILYKNRANYSDETILEELRKEKVTAVHQIKLKPRRGARSISEQHTNPSSLYILSFECNDLPEEVKIGWTILPVREYIPRPRRCFKCNRWGHGSNTCRGDPRCINCGKASHEEECTEPTKCSNCHENHKASSNECFYYRLEQETLIIQTREKTSYWESKSKATKLLTGATYANMVKHSLPAQTPSTRPQTAAVSGANAEPISETERDHSRPELNPGSELNLPTIPQNHVIPQKLPPSGPVPAASKSKPKHDATHQAKADKTKEPDQKQNLTKPTATSTSSATFVKQPNPKDNSSPREIPQEPNSKPTEMILSENQESSRPTKRDHPELSERTPAKNSNSPSKKKNKIQEEQDAPTTQAVPIGPQVLRPTLTPNMHPHRMQQPQNKIQSLATNYNPRMPPPNYTPQRQFAQGQGHQGNDHRRKSRSRSGSPKNHHNRK